MGEQKTSYRVLARKYRPGHFDDLVGQDVLVRTLKNAIESNRVAHAFLLTGIRGVGKTTTARIIAKALNYTGPDGNAGPTTGPTDDCRICRAIAEDRHPDILEMDAASHTGVNDIRDILDGVRYVPASARYKVYIIDEVHMLSASAFNALLKTLEEPPEHVKFIFATTEIRKVPVTVLSRCQRFDLRRVDMETLRGHYSSICEKENVGIESEALDMIVRAADGSVRDGLSLLDQAIALNSGKIEAELVRSMLGLADRSRILDMLDMILSGNTAGALEVMEDLYRSGADPVILIQDLLDFVHLLSRIRAVPDLTGSRMNMDEDGFRRASELAGRYSMPVLGRAWQILVKGLSEMNMAPNLQAAAEMLIIRLGYAADLPDPSDLIKKLQNSEQTGQTSAPLPSSGAGSYTSGAGGGTSASLAYEREAQTVAQTLSAPQTIEEVVSVLRQGGEHILAEQVYCYVRPVKITRGRLNISLTEDAPSDLSRKLGPALTKICGERWMVAVSSGAGSPALEELEKTAQEDKLRKAAGYPLVKEIMTLFPGAEIVRIHEKDKEES
jgi:DNA polymerase-3 subunit gamma/tau